ncbi:Hypothetical predicted protein [Octopus vulgaris]|uniref:Uncharacterized protein n=1 Tax=Octopus vulgaris TaxID=6645 RepID=A0AA36BDN5_OCTVU|nr:Hypothetical predicted protein [Octopus vulgaris]
MRSSFFLSLTHAHQALIYKNFALFFMRRGYPFTFVRTALARARQFNRTTALSSSPHRPPNHISSPILCHPPAFPFERIPYGPYSSKTKSHHLPYFTQLTLALL